jgi:hypothetical protein
MALSAVPVIVEGILADDVSVAVVSNYTYVQNDKYCPEYYFSLQVYFYFGFKKICATATASG